MSNLPVQESPDDTPPLFRRLRTALVIATLLASVSIAYVIADAVGSVAGADRCDLDRRLRDLAPTVGSHSVEVTDKALAGARLIRFRTNDRPEYATVYACRSTGVILEPTEVFEWTAHGSTAEGLAAHYMWVFKEGGAAHLEIVTSADAFAALHFPREAFIPPNLRSGVVSFWHVDSGAGWGPEPRVYQVVIDSRTGLGGERWRSASDPQATRASLIASLKGHGLDRQFAFHELAANPQPDLLPDLLSSLESAKESENPYLGLLGTRGMPFDDNGERLGKLADGPAGKDVRMGVVQALATLAGARPRELASSILQHESDPRARRIMTTALTRQAPP